MGVNNILDHEHRGKKIAEKNHRVGLSYSFVFHMYLKILEDLRHETPFLGFISLMRILNCSDHEPIAHTNVGVTYGRVQV